jgi:hypothetical protein
MNPLIMTLKSACLALAVVVLTATAVQAVPTTYVYTGNPFTTATGPYTTSDFVTGLVTLAAPFPPNRLFSSVTPLAYTFSDGVLTLTEGNSSALYMFATGPFGLPTRWIVTVVGLQGASINTNSGVTAFDRDNVAVFRPEEGVGLNINAPGIWRIAGGAVPDTGSSLTLLSLSITALGVAARRFKRAAT